MQGNAENEVSEELLNEEVTPDELREILDRLGQREFGGSPNSTIRDISESTSADPILIGRLLAEIRNEELQCRLGLQVEEHEQRIEHIEHVQEKIQRQPRLDDPLAGLNSDEVEELRYVAEERRRQREMQSLVIPILIAIILLGFLIGAVTSSRKTSYPYDEPKTSYSMEVDGVQVSGSIGGPFTANDHGKTRPATQKEEDELTTVIAVSEANKSKGK